MASDCFIHMAQQVAILRVEMACYPKMRNVMMEILYRWMDVVIARLIRFTCAPCRGDTLTHPTNVDSWYDIHTMSMNLS